MQDVGRLGESNLNDLCHDLGITINKVVVDETGWDALLEFPFETNDGLPPDLLPAPIECRVQVKSTDFQKSAIQMELSTLHRLVKQPSPAFIVIFEFSGGPSADKSFLVHFDKQLITKVLKRMRQNTATKRPKALNKITLSINYNHNHQFEYSGEGLKNAILSHIPVGMEKYIKNKQDVLKTVGFENGYEEIEVIVTREVKNPIEDILNLTLGLKDTIEVEKFNRKSTRFGIPIIRELNHESGGLLSIVDLKLVTLAEVTISAERFSPGVSFQMDFYNSEMNSLIPREHVKLRLVHNLFEIILKPYSGSLSFRFDIDPVRRYSLDELHLFFKMVSYFSNASFNPTMTIAIEEVDPLVLRGIKVGIQNIPGAELLQVIENIKSVALALLGSDLTTEISLHEIEAIEKQVHAYLSWTLGNPEKMRMEFNVHGTLDTDYLTTCLIPISMEVGAKTMCAFQILEGTISRIDDGGYVLKVSERKNMPFGLFDASNRVEALEEFRNKIEQLTEALDAKHEQVVTFSGDYSGEK